MEEIKKPLFNKETTMIIKGIALLMMEIHYFLTFPSWWPDSVAYPIANTLSPFLCSPMKLCVSIFCFITGYAYFYNPKKNIKYSIKK